MKFYYASYILAAAASSYAPVASAAASTDDANPNITNLRRLDKGGAPFKDQKPYEGNGNNIPKGNPVPTYAASTNICAGQYDNFFAAANNPSTSCQGATNEGGALGTNAPQTGGDVSCSANGALSITDRDGVPLVPITTPFSQYPGDGRAVNSPLCPGNLHFHIGAEHRSTDQGDASYEDSFDFDNFTNGPEYTSVNFPQNKTFSGKRCNFYKNRETNGLDFSTYPFKYCVDVKVGETYEFHWPHSSLAACGDSINQYQEPFVDGLLCNDPFRDGFTSLVGVLAGEPQLLADNIGVQAQIVTVVNDEDYFFPNFYRGMIVNEERGYGQDITAYLGSRTGGGFGANLDSERPCDPVSPVSWQVDRKCQLVSASTLDQMCRDIMSNPGMRQCGEGCDGFPIAGLFKVDDEEDDNFGDICCYPATRPATSRGVVVEQLQADNVQDISNTCP